MSAAAIDWPAWQVWLVIVGLGAGSFALRFSFLGLVGRRGLPDWALRHLRYTAVAVLPGLVAPLVIWPTGTGGEPDPVRLASAAVALGVGVVFRSVLGALASGAGVLWVGLWLVG
ncbi:MAG: AzlD domain-containing protein [Shimia sp.]